jgi:hypothetical protein
MTVLEIVDRYALSVFAFALLISIREIARPDQTKSDLSLCFWLSLFWPITILAITVQEIAEAKESKARSSRPSSDNAHEASREARSSFSE